MTLSPEAAAIPRLRLELDGRVEMLSGYDPAWPESFASDRRQILSLAPNVRLERGRTYIAIPKGWSDRPTTRNGFESRSSDPVTGNAATDTGDSYRLSSLIGRALGRAGLIINRGY